MSDQFPPKQNTPILMALLAFAVIHVAINLYWAAVRPSPPEPDDAYTYILKAAQVADGCALQDCPAVEDLRRQLSDSVSDPDANWLRYRMLMRTTLVYHPLYTAAMLGLGKLGLEWEQTFIVISMLGAVAIGAGLCYFLAALWGSAAAALAVALMAVSAFRGQGLLYVVPSNLALGIALFLWGAAIRGHRGWPLAVLSAAILLMHPIGKLYCVAVVPMMLLMERRIFPAWRTLLSCVAVLGLVGISVLVPMLVERPLLRVLPEPWPPGVSWIDALYKNLFTALLTVLSFDTRRHPLAIIVAGGIYVLAWWGFRQLGDDRKQRVLAAFIPLAGLCLLALGHVLPNYRGEAFTRVWIPFAAVLAGGAGYALVGPGGLLWAPNTLRLPGKLAFAKVRTACLAFLVLAAASGAINLLNRVEHFRSRGFETYEPAQVRRATADCGTFLFAGETAALFYLTHGAHKCAARYLLATASSERHSLAEGLRTAPLPLLLVAPQPGPEELPLDGAHPVQLDLPARTADQVQLQLKAAQAATVRITRVDGSEIMKLAMPGGAEPLWIALGQSGSNVPETFLITSKGAKGQVYLEGVRISSAQTTRWPWGTEVTLQHGRSRRFAFSAVEIGGGLFRELQPVDDRGSTMLAIVR